MLYPSPLPENIHWLVTGGQLEEEDKVVKVETGEAFNVLPEKIDILQHVIVARLGTSSGIYSASALESLGKNRFRSVLVRHNYSTKL